MPHLYRPALVLVAALLLLPLAGCDETGGLSSGSVEDQIRDARFARQTGHLDEALRILEAAFAQDPQSAAVRTEYSLTLLEEREIDLLDLDRLALYLTRADTASAAVPGSTSPFCPYAADPTARPFRPTDYAGFAEIQADRAAVRRALTLLEPVIPLTLRDSDPCTSITRASDGRATLVYDGPAALAEMRARGLDADAINAALSTNALARFLDAFLTLTDDLPAPTTWYRLSGGSEIGICTDDPLAVLPVADGAVDALREALFSIDLRATSSGRTSTSDRLVDLVAESYVEVRDGVAQTCNR